MHHYDDPNYDYQKYWQNRLYEHQSEITAISKLLYGKLFKSMADIGGGFARLYPTFSQFTHKYTLFEPSKKLRLQAKRLYPKITIRHALAHKLPCKANSFDLVSLIRVSHHLPQLTPALREIYRVLKPDGYLLLEFANSANFKSRLTNIFQPIPQIPIEKRSPVNIRKHTIAFVNHHPQTILKLLSNIGFIYESSLSVSNFRSPLLKKIVPPNLLLKLESFSQKLLASNYFGPSIFILAKKASSKPIVDNYRNP